MFARMANSARLACPARVHSQGFSGLRGLLPLQQFRELVGISTPLGYFVNRRPAVQIRPSAPGTRSNSDGDFRSKRVVSRIRNSSALLHARQQLWNGDSKRLRELH